VRDSPAPSSHAAMSNTLMRPLGRRVGTIKAWRVGRGWKKRGVDKPSGPKSVRLGAVATRVIEILQRGRARIALRIET